MLPAWVSPIVTQEHIFLSMSTVKTLAETLDLIDTHALEGAVINRLLGSLCRSEGETLVS
jgi:hypothetical protein